MKKGCIGCVILLVIIVLIPLIALRVVNWHADRNYFGETHFLRNQHHFEALVQMVLAGDLELVEEHEESESLPIRRTYLLPKEYVSILRRHEPLLYLFIINENEFIVMFDRIEAFILAAGTYIFFSSDDFYDKHADFVYDLLRTVNFHAHIYTPEHITGNWFMALGGL